MPHSPSPPTPGNLSRRSFLRTGSVATTALIIAPAGAGSQTADRIAGQSADGVVPADDRPTLTLTVNGVRRTVSVQPRTTLVEVLRDMLGLTGTKIGCNHGQCGACTVLLDGRRINSCLTLALAAEGASVVTIEGLSGPNEELHPMQAAFAEKDAFQCGYCTPGQILSAVACIDEGHAGSTAEIREYMSGNLCRCAAYPNIVAAIESVRDNPKG